MSRKVIDLVGQVFGRLTVIKLGTQNSSGNKRWLCQCSCGKQKEILTNNLTRGTTKSCGCIVRENAIRAGLIQAIKNRKAPGYSNSRRAYNQKKRDAGRRGLSFSLTFEEFIHVGSQNCYYCNKSPEMSNSYKAQGFGEYKHNGMDRIDSQVGYIIDNIVACCWNCNKAKSSLSQEDFYNLIRAIYKNRRLG